MAGFETILKAADLIADAMQRAQNVLGVFGGLVQRRLGHAVGEVGIDAVRNAFLQGCHGAWSLHPSQIDIAKKVYSPDPDEVAFAKRILDAMPDGTGAVMIDGKMQDDATWKQAKVIYDLAELVAAKDPEYAGIYGI